MPQFTLSLPLPAVYVKDNFFVSACNREAYDWVLSPWVDYALVLYGPAGSGKTHLGNIWAKQNDAAILQAAQGIPTPDQVTGPLLLDTIEHADERTLFHLLNHCKEQGYRLLLTSRPAPKQLPFTLPDLTSRLLALPAVAIAPPDDEALAAVMRKQFSDRQLKVGAEVIDYLLPRIERSYAQIQALVEMLDAQALAEHKNLTVPFLKKTLGW